MAEHPIEGMMGVTMEKIRQLVDANTIIGEPITVDGATIIPISRVTFGFASGGSDVGAKTNKQMFGGGTGAGVSIAPIAFLVISGGNVRTIQLVEHVSPVDSAINALPDLVDRISALIKKDKPESSNGAKSADIPDNRDTDDIELPEEMVESGMTDDIDFDFKD